MPAQRRENGGVLITTAPNLRQRTSTSFRQSVRPKPPSWSLPSKRQQTITQMPSLYNIFHPEQENLEYEEEVPAVHQEEMPRQKRRKLSDEQPVTRRVTRSAKKQLQEEMLPGEASQKRPTSKLIDAHETTAAVGQIDMPVGNPMPPPKTPAKSRRREIPSSQTPPDTPWSTHSRRSVIDLYKSPLKDRSTNIIDKIPPPSSPMRRRWESKKEVSDSMFSGSTLSKLNSKSSVDSLKTDAGHISGIPNSQPSVEKEDATQASTDATNPPDALESFVQVPSSPAGHLPTQKSIISSPPINTNPVRYRYSQFDPIEFDPADPSDKFLEELPNPASSQTGLQTESQFENDWRPFEPPDLSPQHDAGELQQIPASQSSHDKSIATQILPVQAEAETPLSVATQIVSSSRRRKFVPPSQATTADITQASHHHLFNPHSSPRFATPHPLPLSSSPASSPLRTQPQVPSSPPLPPAPLSSQRTAAPQRPPADQVSSSQIPASPSASPRTRKTRAGGMFSKETLRKYEWDDGARIRDSQLFPESLMDESLPRVPEGWGDVWGMEVEGE